MRKKIRQLVQHFDEYVEAHAEAALQITTSLKEMLESPAADVVTLLIPGEADDLLKRHIITALEKAVMTLTAVNTCAGEGDINARIKCLMTELAKAAPEVRDALLHKLASLITAALDGGRMKQRDYDLYVQAKYTASR
ncbi:MAG: hypothetical protein IAE95_07315 [Chitinophagaceae bacterium]|nr:hypothetical protein [Chitinophagaceae bacterium]